jgi:hypothetical protein
MKLLLLCAAPASGKITSAPRQHLRLLIKEVAAARNENKLNFYTRVYLRGQILPGPDSLLTHNTQPKFI